MGGRTTIDPWFKWGFIVLRFLVPALALLWLWDLWRRPESQFHGSWPYPRVRWGIVPAAFLVINVVGLIFPKVFWIDVSAIGLIFAMLVFGIAYLLRVVFPSDKRITSIETGADDDASEPGQADEQDPRT